MSLGDNIRKARKERGLTQSELAEKAGISRSYFADVEKGYYNPSLDTLQKIAAALDTTSGVLLGEASVLEFVAADNGLKGAMQFFEDERARRSLTEIGGGVLFPANERSVSDDEKSLLDLYRKLNQEGKEKLCGYADDLVSSGKYIKTDTVRMVQGNK